jgi:hypothetical protein
MKRKKQRLVLNKESVRLLSNESGKKAAGGDWSQIDTCWCDPCAQQTLAESNCVPGPSFNYC